MKNIRILKILEHGHILLRVSAHHSKHAEFEQKNVATYINIKLRKQKIISFWKNYLPRLELEKIVKYLLFASFVREIN